MEFIYSETHTVLIYSFLKNNKYVTYIFINYFSIRKYIISHWLCKSLFFPLSSFCITD